MSCGCSAFLVTLHLPLRRRKYDAIYSTVQSLHLVMRKNRRNYILTWTWRTQLWCYWQSFPVAAAREHPVGIQSCCTQRYLELRYLFWASQGQQWGAILPPKSTFKLVTVCSHKALSNSGGVLQPDAAEQLSENKATGSLVPNISHTRATLHAPTVDPGSENVSQKISYSR